MYKGRKVPWRAMAMESQDAPPIHHDQADRDTRDHALRLGASGGRSITRKQERVDAYAHGTIRKNQITNLPTRWARARSSSASDKSKSARRPKHCTKPPIFGGMENPMA